MSHFIKCIVVLMSCVLIGCSQAGNSVKSQDDSLAKTQLSQTTTETAIQQAQEAQRVMSSTPVKKGPGIEWQPSYSLSDVNLEISKSKLPSMPVGATIRTKTGKIALAKVMKELVKSKNLQLSWASDVKQDAMVDVNILPDDDFWIALNNLLRQLDYTYEFKDGAVIIKHKITRKFMLPLPFLTAQYDVKIGGDLLGSSSTRSQTSTSSSSASTQMSGLVSAQSQDHEIDIWKSIRENLDKILQLAATRTDTAEILQAEDKLKKIEAECERQYPSSLEKQQSCMQTKTNILANAALLAGDVGAAKKEGKDGGEAAGDKGKPSPASTNDFFYTIDKPLGIVTVTAPSSLLEQIDSYFKTLAQEVSRQVMIEAKIVEVTLSKGSEQGIDWTDLLNNSKDHGFLLQPLFGFSGTTNLNGSSLGNDFTSIGSLVPIGEHFDAKFYLTHNPFNLVFDFLNTHGNVKVLSNPKLTMMNGQPSVITVGDKVKYISEVTSEKTNEGGSTTTTYTVETDSILSGLAFGVMASITEDNDVVMQLSPITSTLREPMEERIFGGGDLIIGLPRVAVREMTTMARVKSGGLLIVGGLIDETTEDTDNDVPFLGKLPLLKYVFGHQKDYRYKRELIILLRPQVITM